jgi:anti-anti-sigma factor
MDLHTVPRFLYAMERAAEKEGVGTVVVDLADVAFMDSTALSALMRSKDTLGQQGISLRLAAPSKAVERIFSGLLRHLPLPRRRHPRLSSRANGSSPTYATKKTTVYLPEDLKSALGRIAREKGRSEPELIREAIRDLVSDTERPRLPLFSSGAPTLVGGEVRLAFERAWLTPVLRSAGRCRSSPCDPRSVAY